MGEDTAQNVIPQPNAMTLSVVVLVCLFCLFCGANAYTSEALADQITSLPGADQLTIAFNQFSGYLTIPGTKGGNTKHLHYW